MDGLGLNSLLHRSAVDKMDAEGWIDVLINNAGFGLLDTVEDIPLDDVRHKF